MNPGLPPGLWAALDGRLWHATERGGLQGIIAGRHVQVSPETRYRSSFCRCESSVSVFDFGPTATGICAQFRNWAGWLGHEQGTRVAVWLEIDRVAAKAFLLEAEPARQKWDSTSSRCKTFIPGVEACHKGPVPISAIVGVLLIARDARERFLYCALDSDINRHIDEFEAGLPPPPDDDLLSRLQAGRNRVSKK